MRGEKTFYACLSGLASLAGDATRKYTRHLRQKHGEIKVFEVALGVTKHVRIYFSYLVENMQANVPNMTFGYFFVADKRRSEMT